MNKIFDAITETRKENSMKIFRCAAEVLSGNGIRFDLRKNGAHLIIQTAAGKIDFWPGSGKFLGAANGRGIFPLLEAISRIEAEATK